MKRSSSGVFDQKNLKDIGARIREVRSEKTQEQFAKDINVGRTVLANYEAGRRLPDSRTLEAIADAGGVTVNYILTGMEATADPFQIDTYFQETSFLEGFAVALFIYDRMRNSFSDQSDQNKLLIWANVVPKLAEHLQTVIDNNVFINHSSDETEFRAMIAEFSDATPQDILELIITLNQQSRSA